MEIQVFLGLAVFMDLFAIYLSLVLPEKAGLSIAGAVIYHLILGGIASALLLLTDALLVQPVKPNRLILPGLLFLLFPIAIVVHLDVLPPIREPYHIDFAASPALVSLCGFANHLGRSFCL